MSSAGPLFIALAAMLWAFDALLRTPLTLSISAASIVFYEHVIGLFVLSPFFIHSVGIIPRVSPITWIRVILLSLVSSVLGTILFTQALGSSFATGDFITPLLIQKLQPIIVILLSFVILRERFKKEYFFWATVALAGSYAMSFGFSPITFSFSGKELVVLLSLGAAFSWGSGTILSKLLLRTYSSRDATFLRFLAAIPLSLAVALMLHQFNPPTLLRSLDLLRFIAIGLSTGAVGLFIYYFGLQKTKAHIATIAELLFPATSILIGITALNPYGSPQSLSIPQVIGIALLLSAVTRISWLAAKKEKPTTVSGTVIHGHHEGRKLGFPTANLAIKTPIFLDYGVYACRIRVAKKQHDGIVHYGPRVVFGEEKPLFEVHLFHFSGNLYKRKLTVEVLGFIRGTRNFGSVAALVSQMELDCKKAKRILMIS